MSRIHVLPQSAGPSWLVVANASRARIFERDEGRGTLREIADPVHPGSREKASELGRDRPGRVRKGAVSTAFAPRTTLQERERRQFAHELAEWLERAAQAQRLPAWVLMASSPFLGELRTELGPAAQALLKAFVAADLTGLQGRELERRVGQLWTGQVAADRSPRP